MNRVCIDVWTSNICARLSDEDIASLMAVSKSTRKYLSNPRIYTHLFWSRWYIFSVEQWDLFEVDTRRITRMQYFEVCRNLYEWKRDVNIIGVSDIRLAREFSSMILICNPKVDMKNYEFFLERINNNYNWCYGRNVKCVTAPSIFPRELYNKLCEELITRMCHNDMPILSEMIPYFGPRQNDIPYQPIMIPYFGPRRNYTGRNVIATDFKITNHKIRNKTTQIGKKLIIFGKKQNKKTKKQKRHGKSIPYKSKHQRKCNRIHIKAHRISRSTNNFRQSHPSRNNRK